MTAPTNHWRYYVPSEKGEGWAILFVDDAGAISIVSDWGNYGHMWGFAGRSRPDLDFRHELMKFGEDYVLDKLSYGTGNVIDEVATREEIQEAIARSTSADSSPEDDLLADADLSNEIGCWEWLQETKLPDAHELIRSRRDNGDRVHFVKKAWPRLRALIAAELEAEKQAAVK